MSLEESIAYLEEYFRVTSEEFYGQKEIELTNKVEMSFTFSEAELEEALATHPDFAFVHFSEIQYYNRGQSSICGIEKSNWYISAIVPRVIAEIFKEEFQEARLYESWTEFETDAQKKGLASEKSRRTAFMEELLNKIEGAGYGCIIKDITQKEVYMQTFETETTDILNQERWRKIAGFEDKADGTIQFEVYMPQLKELLMSIASTRFNGLERKRKKLEV